MAFFFITLGFMYIGRRLGWGLSKSVLYAAPLAVCIVLCIVWGAAVAVAIRELIDWQQPGAVLRWIMGYALGGYVAEPSYGLVAKATIPPSAKNRHLLISTLPPLVYAACSIGLAFFLPNVEL